MKHIDTAKTAAETYDSIPPNHPREEPILLHGILHALLALHEQNEPKATPAPRKTAPKESK